MKNFKRIFPLLVILILLALPPVFSQDNPAPAAKEAQPQSVAAPAVTTEAVTPQDLSIYGEVMAVNAASNSVSVQYYDYDNDEEKTAEVIIGKDTKMENASTLNDIKKGDWIDFTYIASDGKFVAKNVIVEKEEEVTTESAPAQEQATVTEEE